MINSSYQTQTQVEHTKIHTQATTNSIQQKHTWINNRTNQGKKQTIEWIRHKKDEPSNKCVKKQTDEWRNKNTKKNEGRNKHKNEQTNKQKRNERMNE